MNAPSRIVLLRHGQSTWNLENRFTGWTDVPLSDLGRQEARNAGKLLRDAGFQFDVIHTSVLERAIQTMHLAQEEMGQLWVDVQRNWRLNERHYGALQGLNKKETAERHGEDQVRIWRRSYDVPPPPLAPDDPQNPRNDPRYRELAPDVLPATECLADVVVRMLPHWHDRVVPDIRAGKQVMIVAHGNSLRALVMHLDGLSHEEVIELNIPTGIPLVYELDANLKPIRSGYLGDPETAKAAAEAVARQGKR